MTQPKNNGNVNPELMFELLDFARRNERRIYETQLHRFGDKSRSNLCILVAREYLRKIKREKPHFYAITSKGLNLFGDKRKKADEIPGELKQQILEKLQDIIGELEIKPWEIKFYIIHVIGDNHPITTEEVIEYFQKQLSHTRGVSRPNVYRSLQHLRMKGYIEYENRTYKGESSYRLSEKGKEIFHMTKTDAARRLRTSEEWDTALTQAFQRMDEERKQDDGALSYLLDTVLPESLENQQLIWVLYTQGNVYELRGCLDKAEEAYLRMEGICEEVKDDKGRAYALKGLGNVAFKQERYSKAEEYYKRCQRIAEELQDNLLLSDVLNNVGSCLYVRDKVDEALNLFEKALQLAGDDSPRRASAWYNEGLCHARKEDVDKARELWLKSLHLYEELQEKVEINKVKHNLTEIDRKQKEERLEENYRRALQIGTSEDIKKAYKELVKLKMAVRENVKERVTHE